MRSARAALTALLLCVLLGFVGCKSKPYETGARFDTTYDFSSVDTFAFSPRRDKVAGSANGKILEQAVREQLVERGYEEVSADSADLLISYDVGVYARASLSGANSFPQRKGGLTVQAFDRRTGQSVWYGWSETTVREGGDAEAVISEATVALFEDQIPARD